MADQTYGLALQFDTDSPEFARGVEVGRLWEQLKGGYEIEQTIHVENAEMAMRLAEATGWTARSEELGHGWIHVVFTFPETPEEQ